MDAEIKKAYLNWSEKGVCYLNSLYAYDTLIEVDQALQKCDEILGEAGLGLGYTSRQSDIDRLMEGRCTLRIYIDALNYYVDEKLDQPLRKDFKKNATETISRIHLEDFEVDNTLGLTENNYIPGGMGYSGTMVEQEKGKLTFADFMGTSDGKAEGNGLHMSFTNGSVEDFESIFAGQYEAMLAAGMLGEENELTQQEFLEQFYKQGEFTHDSSNPFLNFVSSVLDITIIKPIIEACTGEDLITGEDLTDLERGLKVVFAVVDLVTLGGAIAATKFSEIGLKEGLKAFGKTALIDFAGNTAACGVGALGEVFDWPVPVTIMLSLAAGITVSISGNKLLFKNADGIVIRDKVLDEDDVKIVGDTIAGDSKTPSEIARSWQGSGKYPGIDDYTDVTVGKGTILYRGEPNGTEYFTTLDAIEQSGRDATTIFEGLQVEKNPIHGYRGEMQGYLFNEDIASAYGIAEANPQFGKGGLPQYYVPDVQDLIDKGILTPVENIKLYK